MAVAKVKHVDIFFCKHDKEAFLSLIQKSGLIQINRLKDVGRANLEPSAHSLSDEINKVQNTLEYFSLLDKKNNLFSQKPAFTEEKAREVLENFQHKLIFQHLAFATDRIRAIDSQAKELSAERIGLLPWLPLETPLEDIVSTQNLDIIPGFLAKKELSLLEEKINADDLKIHIERINEQKEFCYILVIYLKGEAQNALSLLKHYNFNHVVLPRQQGRVSQVIQRLKDSIKKLNDEKQELVSGVKGLLPQRIKLMLLSDMLSRAAGLNEAARQLLVTDFTCVLSGWIKEKDVLRLESEISSSSHTAEMILREPVIDENVPVALENNKLIQPFEFITNIYGMPKYNELDPTPFLAPFFFIYFGLCVSDVGYGLMLFFICLFVLKKFRIGITGIKFFRLFLFCSLSTIVVGVLTGSWFGNLPDILAESNKAFLPFKAFKDRLIMLDPLQDPTKLLGIALSFGIVQVWFGNIVAIIGNIKNRRYLDILLDQVSMLVFLFGLTGLALVFLKLFDAKYNNIFAASAISGSIALLLTQGRSNPTVASKLFYGLYNLYSYLSGYLSDVLSYSRLWALGLVTGVMASTINLISVQFSAIFTQAIPIAFIRAIIAALIAVVIFIGGHAVSFLMNLLGAFVHPLRLQFVEFFSKFFKSGGSAFEPFRAQSKYTVIE